MSKIMLNHQQSVEESFDSFISSKRMEGLTEKSLSSYKQHFKCISKYLDTSISIYDLTKKDFEQMIHNMRDNDLSSNTIASYVRVIKSFLSWCDKEGLTSINIPRYKAEETIKEVYTNDELLLLLKKPNMHQCNFAEYRNWVIINFLLNCGCRSSTIRNIKNQDIDWQNHLIYFRHTKNKKIQVIPLCTQMMLILKDYSEIRKGQETDYLFCNEHGLQLTEDALKHAIYRYNRNRGVKKTSIHLFRHTFAKKYLMECNGDALTLQRLLGHTTLEMTRHYCNIYNKDIARNFDQFSPLQNISVNNKIKK